MKAKGPAAAKVEEEKRKGLALFAPKPPTPKLLRAVGGNINKTFIDKMKVPRLMLLPPCGGFLSLQLLIQPPSLSLVCFWRPLRTQIPSSSCITPFLESLYILC